MVWKTDVYKTLLGLSNKQASEFADHTQCRLGKWYFEGEGREIYSSSNSFRNLDEPHSQVHSNGIRALQLMEGNDCDGALDAIAQMETASDRVIGLLSQLANEQQGHR